MRWLLGSGSFSDVFLVEMASSSSGKTQAALKRLHDSMLDNLDSRSKVAAEVLQYELRILTQIPRHENIIRLQGVSKGFWDEPKEGFLLFELLSETLHTRIFRWQQSLRFAKERVNWWKRRALCREVEVREQLSRIRHTAVGIARALEFLHAHNILYRDLKPTNIGFTSEGNVKLFDFGLARLIDDPDKDRRLTWGAGTPRYMAPECATSQQYGFPADVYSFGMLLWEISTLQRPFAFASTLEVLQRLVVSSRPSLRKITSKTVKELLKACWSPTPDARPTMGLVRRQLEHHCQLRSSEE